MEEFELRRQARMAMRGVPERLGLSFAQGNIEMRAKPSGHGTTNFEWNGYATVYGYWFPMWDQNGDPFEEGVAPGAAKRSLANPSLDVPFLIGHNDAGIPLARTKSGTMKLADDSLGVHTHVPEMDGRREEVRALASAQERGDIDEMSMAFVCLRQQWSDDYERRTVLEIDLHRGDVCAVTHGANPATAGASMRAIEQLSYRRPAAIGGPVLLGRERRMPTAPYAVHANEDSACPQCQSMNDRDAFFCDQCGARMPGQPGESAVSGEDETQQCQSCLCMNATDAKYCDQCGAGLAGVTPWRAPGGGYTDGYGSRRPAELRASAVDSADAAPAIDVAAADHAPMTGTHAHAHAHDGDAHGGGSAGQSASVTVDATTGIPGEEAQFSAARKLELRLRELELEELATR
jgi:HK97 family phage prohead protease